MRALIPLLLIMFVFHAFAKTESVVKANCENANLNQVPSAFSKFSTEAQRRSNPAQYVQTVEEMISKGPFKYLLECRDQLKADPQFKYNLKFLSEGEGRTMSVRRIRQYEGMMARVSVELSIDLKSSPQRLFFVYIHELTHVCQNFKWRELQARFDIFKALPKISGGMPMMPHLSCSYETMVSQAKTEEDYYRHRKLGEVEAFYNMTKAYQHYTGLDPLFCNGTKEDGQANLYEGYLKMESMINEGYFAQDIIVKYSEDDNNPKSSAALFDLRAPKQLYPDNVLRPALNPEMRILIEGLGLPIIEKR